jgi:hypothetical protein
MVVSHIPHAPATQKFAVVFFVFCANALNESMHKASTIMFFI